MSYRYTAIYSFPRAVLVISVIRLTFVPVARVFTVFTLQPFPKSWQYHNRSSWPLSVTNSGATEPNVVPALHHFVSSGKNVRIHMKFKFKGLLIWFAAVALQNSSINLSSCDVSCLLTAHKYEDVFICLYKMDMHQGACVLEVNKNF